VPDSKGIYEHTYPVASYRLVWLHLCCCCCCAGDYQQAMECYDKALTLNPGNCDAFVARGAARANQRQFEAALQDFKAALRIDPSNANAAKYLQVKLCGQQRLAVCQ
jgi:tetratricopeptide (TPR) repeat protein